MTNAISHNYIFKTKLQPISLLKLIIAPFGLIMGIKSSLKGEQIFSNLPLTPNQQLFACLVLMLILTPSLIRHSKELFSLNDYKKITINQKSLLVPKLSFRNLVVEVDLNEIKRHELKNRSSIGERVLEVIYSPDNNYRNECKVIIFEKYFDNTADFIELIDNIERIKNNNQQIKD